MMANISIDCMMEKILIGCLHDGKTFALVVYMMAKYFHLVLE